MERLQCGVPLVQGCLDMVEMCPNPENATENAFTPVVVRGPLHTSATNRLDHTITTRVYPKRDQKLAQPTNHLSQYDCQK